MDKKAARKQRFRRRVKKIWKFFDENTSTCVVAFAITTVMIFTIVDIVLSANGVTISTTIEEYFYKFFGFEMLALSGIRISKHIGSAFGKAEEAIDGVTVEEEDSNECISE